MNGICPKCQQWPTLRSIGRSNSGYCLYCHKLYQRGVRHRYKEAIRKQNLVYRAEIVKLMRMLHVKQALEK